MHDMTTDRRAPTRSWRWMCVGGTVVKIGQKKKNMSTCLLFGRNQPNLIYKGAQTEERSLLEKRRGKKGRRKLGRQRVEKNDDCCPLPYTVRTLSFLITGATYASFVFLLLTMMLQEMLALRPAPPSATHLHSHSHPLSHSHICMYTYIFIYLPLSICRGGRTSCNTRVSKASIVSTYQTANAMHTLLHHVKRALFFFLFLFFFGELDLLPHGWGEKQGTPQETNSREYIESSHH